MAFPSRDPGVYTRPGASSVRPAALSDAVYELAIRVGSMEEAGLSPEEVQALIDASLVAHEGEADPHSVYLTQPEGDALYATILTGVGPPANGLGSDGDYYLDLTTGTLYGPKSAAGYGAPEHVLNVATPPPNQSAGSYRVGMQYEIKAAGQIVGARFWRNASSARTSRQMQLYNVANSALLGTTVASAEGASYSGWVDLVFPAPIAVFANQRVIIAFDEPTYIEHDTIAPPVVNTNHAIYIQAHYGPIDGGLPPNPQSSITRYADLSWQVPTGQQWPVAIDPAAPVAAHEGEADPHPVYTTAPELATALTPYQLSAQKGQASGYAPLDAGSLIPTAHLPPLAITDTFVVASQAAMLALTAQVGDVCVRSDTSTTYILAVAPATVLANWVLLATPPGGVVSVNGKTGVVSLTAADVGALTQAQGDALYLPLSYTPPAPTALSLLDTGFTLRDNLDPTKTIQFNAAAAPTASLQLFTLPGATCTLVGHNTVQTLDNKTLSNSTLGVTLKDSVFTLQDNSDVTKQVKFEVSGVSPATTRTFTFPDATTVLVGTDNAQALTNKSVTLTADPSTAMQASTKQYTDAQAAAAVTAHVGLADPHPVYLNQARGDARYLAIGAAPAIVLTGTEGLTAVQAPAGTWTLGLTASAAANNTIEIRADGIYAAAGAIPPEYVTDSELTAALAGYLTQAAGDLRYEPFDSAYTKAEADGRYATPANITSAIAAHTALADPHPVYATDADLTAHAGAADPHSVYHNDARGDARYYTKALADARYEPIDTMYTKAESDARYSPAGALTPAAGDAAYVNVGGDTMTGPLLLAATWNNAGTTFPALLRADVTNTASALGSVLLDLRIGATSVVQYTTLDNGTLFVRAAPPHGQFISFNPRSSVTGLGVINSGAQINFTGGGIGLTGALLFLGDNTYDIGGAAAARPRDLFVGRNAVVTTALTVAAKAVALSPNANQTLQWLANGFYSDAPTKAQYDALLARVAALEGQMGSGATGHYHPMGTWAQTAKAVIPVTVVELEEAVNA